MEIRVIDCDFHPVTLRCNRCGFVAPVAGAFRNCPSFATGCASGTELHALLGRFGLTASADCKCNSRAAYMDQMGCDWCEANIDEIVGWLRESAAERGLPFVDIAGRLLVKRAIHNARRKEAARAEGSSLHPER